MLEGDCGNGLKPPFDQIHVVEVPPSDEASETEAPLDEPFDIGIFDTEPGRRGRSSASVLACERRPSGSGRQMVSLVVDRLPAWVGVDLYNKRIDRNSGDRLARVGAD